MQRIALIVVLACLGTLCSLGLWLAMQSPIHTAPAADALQLDAGPGWWEWTLIYRTPRSLDEWYFPVIHEMESAGWV